jgi:hypothetical protein
MYLTTIALNGTNRLLITKCLATLRTAMRLKYNYYDYAKI